MSGAAGNQPAPDRRRRLPFARIVVVLLTATSGTLLALYARADVHIAADGTLVEPFWMVGLGMLTLAAAAVTALASGVVRIVRLVQSRRGAAGDGE
ncbi:MAG: hypothetical protein RLZZ272_1658 [Actinomycetota bacterium]